MRCCYGEMPSWLIVCCIALFILACLLWLVKQFSSSVDYVQFVFGSEQGEFVTVVVRFPILRGRRSLSIAQAETLLKSLSSQKGFYVYMNQWMWLWVYNGYLYASSMNESGKTKIDDKLIANLTTAIEVAKKEAVADV